MTVLQHSETIDVDCTPAALYALVTDVARTGEWSPVCETCWWDEGETAREGAWFTGRNRSGERVWETRSQVTVADPEREFGWVVGGSLVAWSYAIEPSGDGSRLTESWEFLPAGIELFRERYGERAEAEIEERSAAAVSGIPSTLDAIRRIAEAG